MRIRPSRSSTTILTAATRLASSSSFAPAPPPPPPAFRSAPSAPAPVILTGAQRRRLAILGTLDESPAPAESSILYARAQQQPVASSSKVTLNPPPPPPATSAPPPAARSYAPEIRMSTSTGSAASKDRARTALQQAMIPSRRPGATAPLPPTTKAPEAAAVAESKKRPWEAGNHE
ncbi:hypothetical protein BDY24DRAFT_46354 [Mrakia frigida]|uniref:uncharacterized protein n=1 Tax=Mrakia frigida TaxID=29902 RepID=UPI003FCC1817